LESMFGNHFGKTKKRYVKSEKQKPRQFFNYRGFTIRAYV
jgi:SOS response regulatory protein OraA/RecX